MRKKRNLCFATGLLLVSLLQPTSLLSQTVKGFYVNGFHTILGDPAREDSVLRFAKNNGFNYLTLYNLHNVNTQHPLATSSTSSILANFIYKAKTQFDILEIGGVSENFEFTRDVIHPYNLQHPNPLERIDVYNLEFEWWNSSSVDTGGYYCQYYLAPNGDTCTITGAWNYYNNMLSGIDSLANSEGLLSEAYLGWFDDPQAIGLVNTGVDRLFLHMYIPSATFSQNYQYNYVDDRLRSLGLTNQTVKVFPLYSSEPVYMQSWVTTNDFFTPFTLLENSLLNETGAWKSNIQLEGIQWFTYSDMPKKNMDLSVPEHAASLSLNQNRENNTLTIQHTNETDILYEYQLIDLTGSILLNGSQTHPIIDLNPYASGSYILYLSSGTFSTNFQFIK